MEKKLSTYEPIEGFNRVASALIKENGLSISSYEDFDRLFPDQAKPIITYDEFFEQMPILKNTDKFIEAIRNHNKKDSICVAGDYDSDGVMATVIMCYTLSRLGYDVHFSIPNRLIDGYGLSTSSIENDINQYNTKLIITVDNGITGAEAVDIAKKHGVNVIVTDHHLPDNNQIPVDTLIIDPKYNLDNFSDICGAYVALKLCYALIKELQPQDKMFIENLLPLAGIATIADMMPVLEENRQLIKLTLNTINNVKYQGNDPLYKIIYALGGSNFVKNPYSIATEELISFSIGPAINAVSRVSGDVTDLVNKILECLEKPWVYMPSFINMNITRRKMTDELLKEFSNNFDENNIPNSIVYVYDNNEYEYNIRGIVGLIANKISNKYKIVSLVGSMKDDKVVELSGRSVPNFNLYDSIMRIKEQHPEFEINGGGHAQAMGVSLLYSYIEQFRTALEEDINQNAKIYDPVVFEYEPEMEDEIVDTLGDLQPYGQGFQKLTFKYSGIFLSYDNENKIAIISDYKFRMFIPQNQIDELIGTDIDVLFNISYADSNGPIFNVIKE